MEKTYDPAAIEQRLYEQWESNGYFAPSESGEGYSIMIPPPNVTGSLHMGHAFQDAIMDALTRWQRMKGRSALWQVGTDHAGIATQMLVERKLAAEEGKTRHDLGREAFLEKIWEWKQSSGDTITRQLRRLGASVDWESERFTMDEGFTAAVQEVFVRLHREELIYRGKRLVNWDPKLQTAISDLEVENNEESGHLWHFRYPLADGLATAAGDSFVIVATTRPETMLGDSAVAVHPDDDRYSGIVGGHIVLPLTGRRIPVLADPYVDREFGTGCVKITPAHDFNDYAMAQRHKLPLISIMATDASILAAAEIWTLTGEAITDLDPALPEAFAGLSREAARTAIVEALDVLGLLAETEPHTLKVPRGDRSGLIIEPLLTDQWFVATAKLAQPAIAAVENGDIRFVPKQYENMYFSWMRDIQDWCVSRQLWWGHRIPAWYDEAGNVYVGTSEAEVRAHYELADDLILSQDDDVLDTWFSSALWTFATQGWPENTERLQRFHPSDVLVTGFDIIFFWVARMIMMTLHLVKDDKGKAQVPFKTVYVTGLIRDEQGNKMSKSKGNVLDPLDMIDGIAADALVDKRTGNMMQPEQAKKIAKRTRKQFPEGIAAHGCDALRFTLYSLASTGRDINWDMGRLDGYRNFCNKLWNAARYVLMNTEEQDCGQNGEAFELGLADRWIISRLQRTEAEVERQLNQYRFDLAAQALYEFLWNEYCDWYLELSKPALREGAGSEALQRGTRRTLVRVLEATLRLSHPFMPYITEEIWQRIAGLAGTGGDTLMLQAWPQCDEAKLDPEAEQAVGWLKGAIVGVRGIRADLGIGPGVPLQLSLSGSAADHSMLEAHRESLIALARLETAEWLQDPSDAAISAVHMQDSLELRVPLAGLVDKDKEIQRLQKNLEKIQGEIHRLDGKLSNERFVSNAPPEVVEVERGKRASAVESLHKTEQQIEQMRQL